MYIYIYIAVIYVAILAQGVVAPRCRTLPSLGPNLWGCGLCGGAHTYTYCSDKVGQ